MYPACVLPPAFTNYRPLQQYRYSPCQWQSLHAQFHAHAAGTVPPQPPAPPHPPPPIPNANNVTGHYNLGECCGDL